jgi:uncharacterized protein YfaT (DUF1175 family)
MPRPAKTKAQSKQLHRAVRAVRSEVLAPWEPDPFPAWNDGVALRKFAINIMCQLAQRDENGFVRFRAAGWLADHANELLTPQQNPEDLERLAAHREIIKILETKGIMEPAMEPLEMEVVSEEEEAGE